MQGDKEPSQTEQLIGISGLFLISIITVVEANLAFKKAVKIASIKKEEVKTPVKKGWFKYHQKFNSKVVSDYMINKVFELNTNSKTIWDK